MTTKLLLTAALAAGLLISAPALHASIADDAAAAKKAGDFKKAIALYEQAVALEPTNLELLAQLGTVQGWSGRYDDALRTYEVGLRLEPNDASLRYGRACVLAWSGKYDLALAEVTDLIAADPENSDAKVLWARIQSWRKNYDVAESTYRAVIAAHPDHVDALEGLGDLQKWQDSVVEARGFYQRALAVVPDYTELRQKFNSVRPPGRWRLDLDLEHSDFSGSDRPDWNDSNAAVHYAIDKRSRLGLGVKEAHRFGSSNTQYEAVLGRRLDEHRAGYVGASFTRDASFLARRSFSAGGGWKLRDEGEGGPATILLGDYRVASYGTGTAHTAWLGPQVYLTPGMSATARVIASRDLNGGWAAGWQARLDADAGRRWHWCIGYSDAAESINASVIDFSTRRRTRAMLVGLAWSFSAAFSVRVDFAHEAADRTPDRNIWHVGTTTRF